MAEQAARGYRYTVHFRYRRWRGKPDPSDFGTAFMHTDDPEWADRAAAKGHEILSVTDHHEQP